MTRSEIEQIVASVLRNPANGGPESAAKLIASMLMSHAGFAQEDNSVIVVSGRKWRVVGTFTPTTIRLESVDDGAILIETIDSLACRTTGGSQKLAAALHSIGA